MANGDILYDSPIFSVIEFNFDDPRPDKCWLCDNCENVVSEDFPCPCGKDKQTKRDKGTVK